MYQNYFQSKEWSQIKQSKRWHIDDVDSSDEIVHCFRYKSPLGNIIYVPGLDKISTNILDLLAKHYKDGLVIKVEPCIPQDEHLSSVFEKSGWQIGRNIQYTHTVQLDLTKPSDQLLAKVKKRGRYEIRQAKQLSVNVEKVEPNQDNLEKMFDLLANTSSRKQFTIRDKEFIFNFWRAFAESNKLELFFAKSGDKILAGAVIILSDDHKKAWYKEGGSIARQANMFGSRLLIWEVANQLKAERVEIFDLGGIPDPGKYQKSHMSGIYIFKTAFSNEITTMMPAYELRLKPLSYKLWQTIESLYFNVFKKLVKRIK